MPERGLYIVHEGADATGKTEQAFRTCRRLQEAGRQVLFVLNDDSGQLEPIQEPGGVPTANALRRIIKNGSLERDPWTNVILFTAARRLNWIQAMEPALEAGIDVVAARSWLSGVYQVAEGVAFGDIEERTRTDVGETYMHPDLELILAIENESGRQALMSARGNTEHPDTFESKPESFQAAMKQGYLEIAQRRGIEVLPVQAWPHMTPEEIEASKQFVSDEIWKRVEKLL